MLSWRMPRRQLQSAPSALSIALTNTHQNQVFAEPSDGDIASCVRQGIRAHLALEVARTDGRTRSKKQRRIEPSLDMRKPSAAIR